MSYKIQIRKHALKELEALPIKANRIIIKAIDGLSIEPRPEGSKKLKGEKEYMWRIRVGDYRVLYTIEDTIRIVDVRKIGHRRNIYK